MLWLGFADTQPQPSPQPNPHDAAGDAAAMHEPEPESVKDEINAVFLTLLPWGISILFHVGLVFLAIFVVWSTQELRIEDPSVIPVARLSPTPGTPKMVKMSKKMTRTSKTRQTQPKPKTRPTKLASKTKVKTALIGVTGGAMAKANPFSIAGPSGARSSFYGTPGGNARKIVYLIDASGSLVDSLPFVLQELKRSISELTDRQVFTVIFFQGEQTIEVPPRGLKQANEDTKIRVIRWIDMDSGNITPFGRSNPVKAVQAALGYNPQLMFLLSDNITGQHQYEIHQESLLTAIEKSNHGRTKINTIQFVYPDPLASIGLKPTLEQISENTGGIYKFVDGSELGIR